MADSFSLANTYLREHNLFQEALEEGETGYAEYLLEQLTETFRLLVEALAHEEEGEIDGLDLEAAADAAIDKGGAAAPYRLREQLEYTLSQDCIAD